MSLLSLITSDLITTMAREILCDKLDETGFISSFNAKTKRAEKLVSLLKESELPGAIDAIVEVMEKTHAEGSLLLMPDSGFWQLLTVIQETAGSDDADRVASMLSWDEFFGEGHGRSLRTTILEIMGKIGNERHIPALEQFAERMKSIHYEDFTDYVDDFDGGPLGLEEFTIKGEEYNEFDAYGARQAIDACRGRQTA